MSGLLDFENSLIAEQEASWAHDKEAFECFKAERMSWKELEQQLIDTRKEESYA